MTYGTDKRPEAYPTTTQSRQPFQSSHLLVCRAGTTHQGQRIAQQDEARRVVRQLVAELGHFGVDFIVGLGDLEGLFVDLV